MSMPAPPTAAGPPSDIMGAPAPEVEVVVDEEDEEKDMDDGGSVGALGGGGDHLGGLLRILLDRGLAVVGGVGLGGRGHGLLDLGAFGGRDDSGSRDGQDAVG